MRDTFARTLYQVALKQPNVFIVVADISPAGSMAQFRNEFPDRFINVGVAEQSMIGLCAGLALRGCKAFAYTISTFAIYRPFEQVRIDLCYQNLPVTIVGIGGGVSYSTLGGTHHAQEDIAVMGSIPNMSILAPCDPAETEAATWATASHKGPMYLRLGKAGEPDLTSAAPEPFVFGKIRKIREGKGRAIISYGPIMKMAFDIAAKLEQETREKPAIFSAHTIKPLDRDGLAKIMNDYDEVVIVEEHSERAGLAAESKQIAWDYGVRCKLRTFSLRDEFIHVYGSHGDLLAAHGLSVDTISKALIGG